MAAVAVMGTTTHVRRLRAHDIKVRDPAKLERRDPLLVGGTLHRVESVEPALGGIRVVASRGMTRITVLYRLGEMAELLLWHGMLA